MQRILKRFYSIISIAALLTSVILLVNIVPLKNDNTLNNINDFIILMVVYILMSVTITFYESIVFYTKKQSIIIFTILSSLYFLNFFLGFNKVILISSTIILGLILLVKLILTYLSKINFVVNNFYALRLTYIFIGVIILIINFFTTLYLASLIFIMPILLIETLIYFKLKSETNHSELDLLFSIITVTGIFFLSYYSELRSVTRFNFLTSFLLPVLAIVSLYLAYLNFRKNIKNIIKIDSIE